MPTPSRRQFLRLAAVVVATGATACGPSTPQPSSSASTPTPATPTPRSSTSPAASLLTAGVAARVVSQLHAAAGNNPVIQVTITATRATLSVVRDGRALTWAWQDGQIAPADSDIQYVQQASFDPTAFNLADVSALFSEAQRISGSAAQQQLQIVEYNQGQVLMSVATNPESATVFFRSDGSAVHSLDFSTQAGLIEALRDASGTASIAVAVGCDPAQGLWVETTSSQPGVVQRRIRPAKLPAWTASQRSGSASWPAFPLTDAAPAMISRLVQRLPVVLAKPTDTTVNWRLDRRDGLEAPLLRLDVGGTNLVYNLSGLDVTSLVNG